MSKPANYDEQLKYYTERYDEVHVVSCNKCGSPLAFEVAGGVDMAVDHSHPDNRQVIPVSYSDHPQGMALMSWRARLDGVIGYQCGALMDNPDYDKEVKAIDKDFEATKKVIDDSNASAKDAHAKYVKQYPKLLARYEKEVEKNPETILARPSEPAEPVAAEYPDKPEPSADKKTYCLNDTRVAESERYRVPVNASGSGGVPAMMPYEREQLRAEIAASGKKPDVEIKGKVKRVETFNIERIK